MRWFEQIMLYMSIIFIAIFAHPLLTYEFSTPKYGFLLIFMLVIITIYILRNALGKGELEIQLSLAHWGWAIFGIAAMVSTLTVLRENPHYFRYSLEIGLYALFTVFMVFFLSNVLDTKRKVTYILFAALISGFLVAIEALMNYYTGRSFFLGVYGSGGKMDMKAAIGNVNFVSDYLASLLPMAIYFGISYDFGWKIKAKRQLKGFLITVITIKVFSMICFSLFLLVVLLAGTRGVFLSLILGFIILGLALLYYRKSSKTQKKADDYQEIATLSRKVANTLKKANRISMVGLAVIAIFFILFLSIPNNPIARGYSVAERTISIFDEHGFQVTGGKHRLLAWLSSWYQWKETPIIGKGIGTYQLHAVTYMGIATQDRPEYIDAWSNFKRTHNDYFQLLSEMGLFGVFAVVLTLIAMVWLFFKMLGSEPDPDNAYLLMLIAVGFIQMLGHSFTEFPLHLLPNAFLAILYASIGMGRFFNRKGILARSFRLKYPSMMVALFLILTIGFSATVLKWNSVAAETYFKQGSSYYSAISQYQRLYQQALEKKREIEMHMVYLQNRTEHYEILQPENYIAERIARIRAQNPDAVINEAQVRTNLLQELENVIRQEAQRLDQHLSLADQEIQQMVEGSVEMFQNARDRFLRSLEATHCYGKSTFYLGLLMVSPHRGDEMVRRFQDDSHPLGVLQKILSQGWEDTRFIEPQFRDFPFKNDINLMSHMIASGEPADQVYADFRVANMIDGQRVQDQIDYLETTFLSFNEKNAYKLVGQAFLNLRQILLNQRNQYDQLKQRYPAYREELDALMRQHELNAEYSFYQFQEWFDQAIHIMPGNWNMFPEWEPLYREYIENLINAKPFSEVYLKVKEVAEKRIWASEWMILQNRSGPPNDIAAIYRQIADALLRENHLQETLVVLDDAISIMQGVYHTTQHALKTNPHLTSDERQEMELFLNNYEDLRSKRLEYINQLLETYKAAQERGQFQTQFLPDWQHNLFTGERSEMITYEKVMQILEDAKNR